MILLESVSKTYEMGEGVVRASIMWIFKSTKAISSLSWGRPDLASRR